MLREGLAVAGMGIPNKQLLMVENCNPIPGKKLIWYRQHQLKALGVNLQASSSPQTTVSNKTSA
jgi:hypothetical protein